MMQRKKEADAMLMLGVQNERGDTIRLVGCLGQLEMVFLMGRFPQNLWTLKVEMKQKHGMETPGEFLSLIFHFTNISYCCFHSYSYPRIITIK